MDLKLDVFEGPLDLLLHLIKENKMDVEVKKEEPKKEEVKAVEKAEDNKDLSKMTVAELREMAKAKDIKGYSTMKKAELLEALK